MASAEREPIMGIWGGDPRGPGAKVKVITIAVKKLTVSY